MTSAEHDVTQHYVALARSLDTEESIKLKTGSRDVAVEFADDTLTLHLHATLLSPIGELMPFI